MKRDGGDFKENRKIADDAAAVQLFTVHMGLLKMVCRRNVDV